MKVIATIEADLQVTPIGTRSRLAEELGGTPVLRRTVERVSRVRSLSEVYVLCPIAHRERCERLLEGTGAIVRGFEAGPAPWAALVRSARKWALDGWRGGVGGTTVFDEYTNSRLIDGLLKVVQADAVLNVPPAEAVLSVPPAAVAFDPDLASRMIEHRRSAEDDARVAFTQAPPGVSGILLDASLVRELAQKNTPIGAVFAYKPDSPRKDLIFESCCCEIPASLRFATGRLIADTDRATKRLAELLSDHPTPDLETIGDWLLKREAAQSEALPREIEIELTTDTPYPNSLLRPRGDRLGRRGVIDPATVERIADEIGRNDDSLCVLGGFGDPVRHPRFTSILDRLRPAGPGGRSVYGLAVRTTGTDLDEAVSEALVAHGVDILCVSLDAWTPELYAEVQGSGCSDGATLDEVLGRLNRLTEVRERHESAAPIVVPEFCKAKGNVGELDEFYDGWLRRLGTVSIIGYNHHARQLEDRAVIGMAPPSRTPCRRIRSRCLVLADGRVAACDQDFRGLHTIGRIGERSLEEIWCGAELEQLRNCHESGAFDSLPLCASCDEWHRP